MEKSFQLIHEYKIELLHKWINKKLNYIALPPDTKIDLGRNTVWGRKVDIGVYDCLEAGHAEILNAPSDDYGLRFVDTSIHESLAININKSYMSSNSGDYFFSDNVYIPPPFYGCSVGFSSLPLFTINKIEIYSEDFVLDDNNKNTGKFDPNITYSEKAIRVNHDCVLVLYDVNDKILVFESTMGGFTIYANKESLNNVINRVVNGYTSYENPVTLNLRLTIR